VVAADQRRDYRSLPDNILTFALRHTRRGQIWLVILATVSFPFLYAQLDLPKTIINEIIAGKGGTYSILGTEYALTRALLLSGAAFLALVVVNGGLKFISNVLKAKVGWGAARIARAILYRRFRTQANPQMSGEKVPILTAEADSLVSFVGEAISTPIFQGGTVIVIVTYVAIQDWVIALTIVPYIVVLVLGVPPIQQRVNAFIRRSLLLTRHIAQGIVNSRSAKLVEQIGYGPFRAMTTNFRTLYRLDFLAAVWSYLVKLIVGLCDSLHYLGVLMVGGSLVLDGTFTLGALVASLVAVKDLKAPLVDLVDYYQLYARTQTRYAQIKRRLDDPAGVLFTPA
jgi:putative ABC transport system ATP-binding protein